MGADDEYVKARWVRAEACPYRDGKRCCISLGGRNYTRVTVPDTIDGYAPNEEAAWSAARAFTEQREEEIRQLDAQMKWLRGMMFSYSGPDDDLEAKGIMSYWKPPSPTSSAA